MSLPFNLLYPRKTTTRSRRWGRSTPCLKRGDDAFLAWWSSKIFQKMQTMLMCTEGKSLACGIIRISRLRLLSKVKMTYLVLQNVFGYSVSNKLSLWKTPNKKKVVGIMQSEEYSKCREGRVFFVMSVPGWTLSELWSSSLNEPTLVICRNIGRLFGQI